MNLLFNKPNLLFLIFVRNQNRALLLSQLCKPIYKTKLIKALTTIVKKGGTQVWYINDKIHREDGPAIIWASGAKSWWINDKFHREDGPAVIWANGTQEWWINDKRHREDGPAILWANGSKKWFINGEKVAPF